MLVLDGSILEGGGQILRLSVALSALLDKSVTIENIRAGRKKPGLAAQHLTGLKLVCTSLCSGGQLDGGHLQSTRVEFRPRGGVNLVEPEVRADVGTAGGVCLLAQIALPCLLFNTHPVRLHLRGGTNADFAPQVEFFEHVARPIFAKFGIHVEILEGGRRGYFPKGGGLLSLQVDPLAPGSSLRPIQLTEPGEIREATVFSHTAGAVPTSVARRMADAAAQQLKRAVPQIANGSVKFKCVVDHLSGDRATGNGSGVQVVLTTSTGCVHGGDGVGSPKRDPTELGRSAAEMALKSAAKVCVDQHMQDQIIVFMALAEGQSSVLTGPLEMHTRTAIHFAEIITGVKFEVEEITNEKYIIKCNGIGHKL